ncbi:MAG: orotidine-5'-phosphate decarboxylase [Dehalococcoidia bacterium]
MTGPSTGSVTHPLRADSFRAKYEAAAARNHSLLCVGLDPDPALLPPGVDVADFLRAIIEATADLVCCYKPNAAFFEPDGAAGWQTLKAVIDAVPDDVPVLLDAKRGDVGHTSEAYARAVFETLGADAVTANPYLGADGLEPFFTYEDHHTFVLCRTSNAGSRDFQDLLVSAPAPRPDRDQTGAPSPAIRDGEVGSDSGALRPLYEHVAMLANRWNTRGNVGLVVGATYPDEAARVRSLCPDLLFLLPGIGAQQGDVEVAVRASVDAQGGGILINSSRGILYASRSDDFAAAARGEALRLRDTINAARR